MREAAALQDIRLALGRIPTVKLWRNNCGAYKDDHGRLIRYGVANPGGSDLIGMRSVVITSDMVGKTVAVICALEVKHGSNRATPEQENFIRVITAAGGLAGVVRTPDDARALLRL